MNGGANMPTKDSIVKSARIKIEDAESLDNYLDKEGITFAKWLTEQIKVLEIPKVEGVDVSELVKICDRMNQNPQVLIDALVREIKRG